ncbi:MAG: sugar phosphate isomerase/epimerase family protein [Candidatus Hinthialibacter antarcticus]|nr:sugar phosphate isomerase/epimerase family protein [Candidatus Hinthialibacter antarcticus]
MSNDKHENRLSRRALLSSAMLGVSAAALAKSAAAQPETKSPSVVIFSKHLGWTKYDELAALTKEIGFDGVDLTVRPGGHVLPERVQDDLPKAVEAVRGAGLEVAMITTQIAGRDTPYASDILATASALGVPFFRWGTFRYNDDQPRMQQLLDYKPQLQDLAGMAAHFNMRGGYHNHSGDNYIGSAIWDLDKLLEGVEGEWLGSNFDIGHAFCEGSGGAWETNFELIAPRIKMSAVKDFCWLHDKDRGWRRYFPALGEGIVQWKNILSMMKASGFTGPFSIHHEYNVAGKDENAKRKQVISDLKKDLTFFRGQMKAAGWA